ncbi:MAG: hypothetical protein M3Q55_02640 [Acidobacteriota bacterium]|nr:hypothetical protein [Acidobacteriota bacterium]
MTKWGWLKPFGKWIAKTLINAGREHVEKIIDEKKKRPAPSARPTTSRPSAP